MLTIDRIEDSVASIVKEYPLKRVSLFGSYAGGKCREDSDVDFIVEFTTSSVSLFTLMQLKGRLEEMLGKDVDVIHGPLTDDSLIEIDKEVVLYES